MRKFKFRLEAVLKHRTVIEDLRLQAFAAIQRELAESTARLEASRVEYARTVAERSVTVDLEDIARRERYLDALSAQMEQEQRLRDAVSSRLADARTALIAARQAREAIERVKRSDYEAYMQAAAKAEQAMLDEIAILGHERRGHGLLAPRR